ncbi:MAG: STAS domain-containing protein, partial [Chloroflexus sp.]
MPTVLADIADFCEVQLTTTAEVFTDYLRAQQANYAAMDRVTLLQAVTTSLQTLWYAIATGDIQPLLSHARAVGEARAASGFIAGDLFTALNELRHVAWDMVEAYDRDHKVVTVSHIRQIEDVLQAFGQTLLTSFSRVYREMQAQIYDQA